MYSAQKKYTTIIIMILWFFSSILNIAIVQAEVWDMGHWRDSVWEQIPGTTFAGFNFDQEIRNDGIYTKLSDDTVQLDQAGDYLIISTTHDDGNNGRYNSQMRVSQISGNWEVFTSHYSGYSRNTADDDSWTRAVGVIIWASANSQIQIQKRRDTDSLTNWSVANLSDLQVIRLQQTNYWIYGIGGTGNVYGWTIPNTIDIDSVVSESNTAAIQGNTVTDTINVKWNDKKYLIAWSVSLDGGNTRTQRIWHLEYDGIDALSTRTYCYQRNAANEYCGLWSMDLIQTANTDIAIQAEVFRGSWVWSDQWGADADSQLSTDGNWQMIVLEMPDYLEVFSSQDSVWLQDLTTPQILNIARDVKISDPLSFEKDSDSQIRVTNPADIFSWANIWAARSNVLSGARQISYGSISIDGTQQTTGRHWNYSRWNQGTIDTFGLWYQPAGAYTTSGPGSILWVTSTPIFWGSAGWGDRTQAGTLGFFALNLDTLVAPSITQSAYRFFANTNSTDIGSVLADQNTAGTLTSDGQAFRLRSLISVSQNQLRQNEKTFKLQFAEKVWSCDLSFTGEIYSDVTASSAIAFNNNLLPADDSPLTANVNDPTNGATSINQSYQELNNFTTSVARILKDQNGKWDFSLIDNTAPNSLSYCFRIVESDGTLLDSYDFIPEITTFSNLESPGWEANNLNLWLKADTWVLTDWAIIAWEGQNVRTWQDQSPGSFDATQGIPGSSNNIQLQKNVFNFNPIINFDGTAAIPLENNNFTRNTGTSFSHFVVARSQSQSAWWNSFIEWAGWASRAFFLNNRYASNTPYNLPLNETSILAVDDPWATLASTLYENGNLKTITPKDFNTNFTTGRYVIWDDSTGWNRFDGDIAEIITYDSQLSAPQRNQIHSYLATKYWITLDQSLIWWGIEYVDSNGNTYWENDVTDTYEHDIFGIWRDDISTLNQKVSGSNNNDWIITVSLENDFISDNQNTSRTISHANDLQYLMLSNDNNSLTTQTSEIDWNNYSERIGREWKIQKTLNFTQNVHLKFDGFNDEYVLLFDSDGDFSSGSTELGALNTNGEISNISLVDWWFITLAKASETIPPVISSLSIASGSLLPWGNHDLIIQHNDLGSGIDTSSVSYILNKWDGVSAYWADISASFITPVSITQETSQLSLDNLTFWKYRFIFNVSDNDGNMSSAEIEFYIDEPEFSVSTSEIDLWVLWIWAENFSPSVTVTVKTVGAGFDVTFDRSTIFTQWSQEIQSFTWWLGYWFQQFPFTNSISPILNNQNIAAQAQLININGEKNTYTYDIQIWALINMQQAWWDYIWNLDFSINLEY